MKWLVHGAGGMMLLGVLMLQGCVTSGQQCQPPDWYLVGKSDGTHGQTFSRVRDDQQPCHHKIKSESDELAYQRGWQDGVVLYCRSDSAHQLGLDGRSVRSDLCDKSVRAELLRANQYGQCKYQASAEAEQLRALITKSNQVIKTMAARVAQAPVDTRAEVIMNWQAQQGRASEVMLKAMTQLADATVQETAALQRCNDLY